MKRILLLAGILVCFTVHAQIPSYVAANGLVAYWPFTGNANDISGNGNNGIIYGATLATGHTGGGGDAYYFSSSGCATYIQTNVNTTSINTNGAMSLSFWVKRFGDGCLNPRIMEFGSCSTCAGQILIDWVNSSSTLTIRHYLTATSFISYSYTTVASGNWYHIAYTNDGKNGRFYLNGALMNTVVSPNIAQLAGNTAFGRMNHSAFDAFNGYLDDIGLWSRALSSCEINNLYTGNASSTFAFNPLQDTTIICDSILLDAGSGFSNYQWSYGATTQSAMIKSKGWCKIKVTNSLGCEAWDSTFINIIKPTITASTVSVCKGANPVTLTATGIPGTTQTLVDQFTENFTAPWSHTVNSIVGQEYMLIISGTLSDHCVGGDTYNNADAAFFYDRSPIEKVTVANAPSRLFTRWNGIAIRPDADVYNLSHTYTYTLPAATTTTQVFSYADASGAGSYGDNCGQLSFQVYKLQKSTATYSWSAVPAGTSGLNVADIHKSGLSVTPTVTTTYFVTVNDGITSCTDSIKITVAPVDTSLTVSGQFAFCSGEGKASFFAASGQKSYEWLRNTINMGLPNSNTLSVTQEGNYRVIITNNQGCRDTGSTYIVNVYPLPTANFDINNTVQCMRNNNFVFTNLSSTSSGTLMYDWSLGDSITSTDKDISHSYSVPNDATSPAYKVRLITISNNGCRDTIQKNITVNPIPARPVITPGGPTQICGNGSVSLSASNSSGIWTWFKNGQPISGINGQNCIAPESGVYTVTNSINNCESDASSGINVSILPAAAKPAISANGPTSVCGKGTVLLASSIADGNTWLRDNSPISGSTSANLIVSETGSYKTVVNNACGTDTSAEQIVTFYPLPANERYPTVNVQIGTNFPLQARNFGTAYYWNPPVGLNRPDTIAPVTDNFSRTQDYIVQIKTGDGCFVYDTLLVKAFVVKGILVPTAFSPNGDGLNDILKTTLINMKMLTYFRIFNKWGQLIFESANPQNGWDGTFKGKAQSVDNYIWIAKGIDTDGKNVENHGQVLLVR